MYTTKGATPRKNGGKQNDRHNEESPDLPTAEPQHSRGPRKPLEQGSYLWRQGSPAGYYYNGKNKPCYFAAAYEFLGDDRDCEAEIGLRAVSEVEFEDDGHAIAWAMRQ